MANDGRTIIFISHKLHEVKAVADRVTVLRAGRSIETVLAADSTPQSLTALMVGRELGGATAAESKPRDEVVLEVDDLWAEGDRGEEAVKGVSLRVRAGEMLAIAGVAGNGQRELAETITGMRPALRGGLRLGGAKLTGGDPRKAIRAGIAHVPEDRLGTGVAPSLTVASNVVLKSYRGRAHSRGPFLRRGSIRRKADELIRIYDVRGSATTVARQLSGGNLQKVVLGREFSGDPKVLVAASPTRGLDVAAIETVHGHLRDAAGAGMAILLISEDLDEILALADRIVVMYEGAIVGEVDPKAATVNEIGLLMAGGGRS
jgi:simple sugar transport system ATP-binding protein